MTKKANLSQTIGRFAPSPTGELHIGSLITAVTSYCLAKRAGGQWLVRIEDVDTQRCHTRFSSQILHDLDRLGLHWDGAVRYQSAHLATYHALLDNELLPMTYGCDCSRKSIEHYLANHPPSSLYLTQNLQRYPQLCAAKHLPRQHAIRLRMPYQTMLFFDQLQGIISGNPQLEHGDIVLRRRAEPTPTNPFDQGMINYMLAVVIDDAIQGVNQIVRGLDILPLTLPQMVLMDYLKLPLVHEYYHLPILVNEKGQKLSKQTLAEPIAPYSPQQLLSLALTLLGQKKVESDTPSIMLQQAIEQWDNRPLFHQKSRYCGKIEEFLI